MSVADGETVVITGTASITSLGTGYVGCFRELRFSGAATLVHSTNLILPNGVNITTNPPDFLSFRCVGTGIWVMTARGNAYGYIPVNKAGDTAVGPLSLTVAVNQGLSVTDGSSSCRVGPTSLGGSILLTTNATALRLGTNNAERMTIAATGEITTSAQLTVVAPVNTGYFVQDGTITARFGTSSLGGGVILTQSNHPLIFGANSAEVGRFDTSGNLTVVGGVTPGGGRKLQKITLSSSAPGVLADGELYLRY